MRFRCSEGTMMILTTFRTVLLALALSPLLASAAGAGQAVELLDELQAHLARCQDFRYEVACFERKGDQQEERRSRFFVKGERLVRVRVLQGRDRGSEAVLDPQSRVRARKGGLLRSLARTLRPDDSRVCSLRGTPFWEAAYPHFLKALRARAAQPGVECDVRPDRNESGLILVTLRRPGKIHERYWIDAQQRHLVKGEVFEDDLLVQRFTISDIQENVGLNDRFFSF